MKTRDRILQCSLALFNEEGEPNVTTLHVATELDISPGNLYYHFKGKDSIIAELFADFESELFELQITELPEDSPLLNMWAYLQLSFETMARYLFLFRDVADLLTRYPALQRRFNIILAKQRKSLLVLCRALNDESELLACDEDVAALVEHMTMTMTFWLNYQRIRAARMDSFQPDLADCAYQVVSLLVPYLADDSKQDVKLLAQGYL
ncbi:MAG: TetR/AcrR family transcriptional regulator [Pseudomonadales bacterium]